MSSVMFIHTEMLIIVSLDMLGQSPISAVGVQEQLIN